jgi:hypothetical protein
MLIFPYYYRPPYDIAPWCGKFTDAGLPHTNGLQKNQAPVYKHFACSYEILQHPEIHRAQEKSNGTFCDNFVTLPKHRQKFLPHPGAVSERVYLST